MNSTNQINKSSINSMDYCWGCNPDLSGTPNLCAECKMEHEKKRKLCWGCHVDKRVGTLVLCGNCEYQNQNTKYRPPLVFKIPDRIKPHSEKRGPCVPHSMIGRSWWKKNGFSDDCYCAWTAEFEKQKTQNLCDLCDDGYYEKNRGNNADPVCVGGFCCDSCNQNVIIPARIKKMKVMDSIEQLVLRRENFKIAEIGDLDLDKILILKYVPQEYLDKLKLIRQDILVSRKMIVEACWEQGHINNKKYTDKMRIENWVSLIDSCMYVDLLQKFYDTSIEINEIIKKKNNRK